MIQTNPERLCGFYQSWGGSRSSDSTKPARNQGFGVSSTGAGTGAVSRMNRSSAATIAAASGSEAPGAISSSFGRRFGTARSL